MLFVPSRSAIQAGRGCFAALWHGMLGFAVLDVFFSGHVLGDGLPYSDDGELMWTSLVLIMSDKQFTEVDTTRMLTLDREQQQMLSRLFKKVPDKLMVISSQFNDSFEEGDLVSPHCIWLRNRMIAVMYDERGELPAKDSVALPDRFVISSDSKIYKDGKELSVSDVFNLIEDIASHGKPDASDSSDVGSLTYPAHPLGSISFSLPPKTEADPEIKPETLLKALQIFGVTKNVGVLATW